MTAIKYVDWIIIMRINRALVTRDKSILKRVFGNFVVDDLFLSADWVTELSLF